MIYVYDVIDAIRLGNGTAYKALDKKTEIQRKFVLKQVAA